MIQWTCGIFRLDERVDDASWAEHHVFRDRYVFVRLADNNTHVPFCPYHVEEPVLVLVSDKGSDGFSMRNV